MRPWTARRFRALLRHRGPTSLLFCRIAAWIGAAILWAAILLLLAVTFVPAFLDRVYYDDPHSDHYDGERFENPDGEISFPVPPGERRGNLFWRFMLGCADRAPWPEHVDVRQTKVPSKVTGKEMRATWVGHATVLVQAGALNILTDPQWSDYASPFPGVGPRRVAEPGIAFDDLPKIDIVVVSPITMTIWTCRRSGVCGSGTGP